MGGAKIVITNRKAAAGETFAPDGTHYAGIRFCILVGGEERCGSKGMVTEWKRRPIVPTCKRCLEVAEYQLRPTFLRAYPEVQDYLDWSNLEEDAGRHEVPCFVPRTVRPEGYSRIRGGVDYCSRANNGFQALNADGTKAAVRAVGLECYGFGEMGRDSPLYGSRPIMMVHDEIFAEVPEDRAHEAAHRMSEIMVREMRRYIPDVYVAAEPAVAKWWSKGMEATYRCVVCGAVGGLSKCKKCGGPGRLIPWDHEAIALERQAA